MATIRGKRRFLVVPHALFYYCSLPWCFVVLIIFFCVLFIFCMCVSRQDYTEEFRDISKGKSKESLPAGSITLINQRPVGDELHVGRFYYLLIFVLRMLRVYHKVFASSGNVTLNEIR